MVIFYFEIFMLWKLILGKYAERGVPTSVTIIQFSGIGSDARYQPGTQGLVKNTPLRHYKIELGPIDISKLSA